MKQYALTKLIEEAAEVVQSAAKVQLHGRSAEGALVQEMADLSLILDKMYGRLSPKQKQLFAEKYEARRDKEDRKGKL